MYPEMCECSRFLPRAEDDKLQFELEAFRFAQGDNNDVSKGKLNGYCKCLLSLF